MSGRFIGCPEIGCSSPAEIVSEELWPSTDGGMVMARIFGACGHNFLLPAEKLEVHELLALHEVTIEPSPGRHEQVSNRRMTPHDQ